MVDYFKQILALQFEAALCMMDQCIRACPAEHWEGRIANDTFRQVAYHTLFYLDFYLCPGENAFVLRDLNLRGGDERGPTLSPGLSKEDTLEYVSVCREAIREALAAETRESLEGPSGFSWRKCSRGELHLYSMRHLQHHTGAMSAYLRRVDPRLKEDLKALPWVGSGWRSEPGTP